MADTDTPEPTTEDGGVATLDGDGAATGMIDGSTAVGDFGPRMNLDVTVEDIGPCRKHVRVTVPQEDVASVYDAAVGEVAASQPVPGFRAGKVPPSLVRRKFRKELEEQVKQAILLQSLEQVSEEQELDPINEPDLDIADLDVPEDEAFTYEFDVEVRPEFDLPDYAGMKIDRPASDVSDEDVDAYYQQFMEQYAELVDSEEPAAAGDIVVCEVRFVHDGSKLSSIESAPFRVKKTVRFQDAELEEFDTLMEGATPGDERSALITLSQEAPRVDLRNEPIETTFVVQKVQKLQNPELDEEFLDRLDVESEEELRDVMAQNLERQATYKQRQATRQQVIDSLVDAATWDLPEELVNKQTENALRREILEMQQAGFTTDQIRARENDLRRNAISMTRRNLKEHFVLDRIADAESIEVSDNELESEIALMAYQSGENVRRVRARLIKSGVIENLRAQVRERKAVDVILAGADFNDIDGEKDVEQDVFAISRLVAPLGGAAEEAAADGEDASDDTANADATDATDDSSDA